MADEQRPGRRRWVQSFNGEIKMGNLATAGTNMLFALVAAVTEQIK